jgi:ubiquinone/menaquinone biosynthesis C-methylase UbiE
MQLGPNVLRKYGVRREKVVLCLGSFYELEIPDESLDFVLLAQAFHHADDPDRLLREIRRVLKPNGIVSMIGEHVFDEQPSIPAPRKFTLKRAISRLVSGIIRRLIRMRQREQPPLASQAICKVDPVTGDHYYTLEDYHDIFSKNGFRSWNLRGVRPNVQSFVLLSEK